MNESESSDQPRHKDFLGGNKLEGGIGLCLSGGGFRAMLFHLGAIVRLNEMGLLPQIKRVSSVSGGSLAAGALAVVWKELTFDSDGVATNLAEKVGGPIMRLARKRVDIPAILLGLLPFFKAANVAAEVYDRVLFYGATLQDLPESPRFTFDATSLQTGSLWRFAREYAAEYRVGGWNEPTLRVALAVGASAAFPPFMSPMKIELPAGAVKPLEGATLCVEPYTRTLFLTDGGIYDNLGLEPVWKRYRTILVSNGGLVTAPQERPSVNWLSQANRVTNVALQQGIDMRIRTLRGMDGLRQRKLVYWDIGSEVDSYRVGNPLSFGKDATKKAARVSTRLTRFPTATQNLIMMAGYAQADAALRSSGLTGLTNRRPSFSSLPIVREFWELR